MKVWHTQIPSLSPLLYRANMVVVPTMVTVMLGLIYMLATSSPIHDAQPLHTAISISGRVNIIYLEVLMLKKTKMEFYSALQFDFNLHNIIPLHQHANNENIHCQWSTVIISLQ